MASGGVRLARGWTGAAAATFASMLSHMLAGGGAPAPAILILALALSGLVCTLFAGRVLSLWRMAAGVALSQAVFHWLFSANAAMANVSVALLQGPHAAHDMGPATAAALTAAGGAASGSTSAAAMSMNHDSAAMWLGHALAAVATVAVLRHGEVTAVRLLRALRMRLVRLHPPAITANFPLRAKALPPLLPVLPLPNLGAPLLTMRHRGPPHLPALI